MKRLLILSAVVLAAGASGCKNCSPCGGTTAYRPFSPTPACCTPTTQSYGTPVYSTPGAIAAPTLSDPQAVPMQTYPGPEAYTPAN